MLREGRSYCILFVAQFRTSRNDAWRGLAFAASAERTLKRGSGEFWRDLAGPTIAAETTDTK